MQIPDFLEFIITLTCAFLQTIIQVLNHVIIKKYFSGIQVNFLQPRATSMKSTLNIFNIVHANDLMKAGSSRMICILYSHSILLTRNYLADINFAHGYHPWVLKDTSSHSMNHFAVT